VLAEVTTAGGNLTHLQSRPVHGRPWQYHFFIDALMPNAGATEQLLDRMSGLGSTCRLLGQFEPAVPEGAGTAGNRD
jgi:prephenate dehydratase